MNSRGFTLIEVLIAIVIISCSLVLMVEGMGRSQEAIGISKNLITAGRIAEEKLMELELEARQGRFIRTSSEKGREIVSGRVFNWTRQIGVYPDPSIEDQSKMNEASAGVEWKEGPVRKNKLEISTLFLNREKKE